MNSPTDIPVLITAANLSIARTLRMALRGIGVRSVRLVPDIEQILATFLVDEPQVVIVFVDGPSPSDDGLKKLWFLRRSEQSPNKRIPIVAVSPQRDLATINAVIEGGAHEYVLFPSSGDSLLKKVIAARTPPRAFIETPDYVGPERRPRSVARES